MRGGGALESHVSAVAECAHVLRGERLGLLGHRDGLARKSRFIHLQLRDFDQPQVGGNLVAGLQQHDVAGHQHGGGYHLHRPAAQHGGVGRGQLAQRRHGLVRTPCLHKADHGIEHHDDEDDQRVGDLAHQPRDDGGTQQHQHHEVLELVGQQMPPGSVLAGSQLIGAVGGAAAQGLVRVQPGVRIDAVGLGDSLQRVQMRIGGRRHAAI